MSRTSWDIEKKGENSHAIYWGVGPTVTVREAPRHTDARRYLCLTDLKDDCEHVKAVRHYLHDDVEVAA